MHTVGRGGRRNVDLSSDLRLLVALLGWLEGAQLGALGVASGRRDHHRVFSFGVGFPYR